jgi:TonB family protein
MKARSAARLAAGIALLVAFAFAFAGCGNKPEARAPGAASASPGPASAPEPKGDRADGRSDDKADAPVGDDPGGDQRGEDKGDKETRTTEVIAGIVRDNRKPVRECFDKAKKNLPALSGTMTIHFVLDPDGKVKKAELNLERSEIKSPEVANCAIDVIKKIKFPPSSRGMESEVNYPFNFKP